MTILIVAAMASELRPLLARADISRRITSRRVDGEFSGLEFSAILTGEGAMAAGRAVREALDATDPDHLIALGIAGALSVDLRPLDVFHADRVFDGTRELAPPDTSRLEVTATRAASVLTSPRVLGTPVEKQAAYRALGIDGPAAVDLESAAIADAANERCVPYSILRAISDAADESLPIDVERFRRADGLVSRGRIARHALVRPWTWAGLVRLRRRTLACGARLADCIERIARSEARQSPVGG